MVKAQFTYSPNTYYLIAPTSGCNGVWAIKDTIACSVYAVDPCWQFDYFNGDTLFLKLCSIPCSIFATTSGGDPCLQAICDTTASTGINNYIDPTSIEITWIDNNIFTLKNTRKNFDKASIISMTGQIMKEWSNITEKEVITFDMNNLRSGLYILQISRKAEIVNTRKIMKY
jgi:hypothetical protein